MDSVEEIVCDPCRKHGHQTCNAQDSFACSKCRHLHRACSINGIKIKNRPIKPLPSRPRRVRSNPGGSGTVVPAPSDNQVFSGESQTPGPSSLHDNDTDSAGSEFRLVVVAYTLRKLLDYVEHELRRARRYRGGHDDEQTTEEHQLQLDSEIAETLLAIQKTIPSLE